MILKKGHEYIKKYPKKNLFVTSKNIKKTNNVDKAMLQIHSLD